MASIQPNLSAGTTKPTPNPAPIGYIRLRIIVAIFRFFQTVGKWCDLYLSIPLPSSPAFKITIPSTVSSTPGKIPLLFYTPKSYTRPTYGGTQGQQRPLLDTKPKHPILINLHGGGYTIGSASDDARWCTSVTQTPSPAPVVISVDYRLAPAHPFPIGIEDVVSTILFLWRHADEYNLDITKTALSGFSAGGQFCFTVLYRLHDELEKLKREGKIAEVVVGKIVSLVAFYPPTDWTRTRKERAASNPDAEVAIPPFVGQVMEQSYLSLKPENMGQVLLSPSLASDELLRKALPEKMVIMTCWSDALMREAETFRERLKALGKEVEGYVIPGVGTYIQGRHILLIGYHLVST